MGRQGGPPAVGAATPAAGHRTAGHRTAGRHPLAPRPSHAEPRFEPVPTLPGYVTQELRASRPLESPWVPAGLLAAAVLLAVLWRWSSRRRPAATRRGRRLRATGATTGTVLLLVLAALAALNSYVGYVPTVGALLGHVATPGSPAPQALGPAGAGRRIRALREGSRIEQDEVGAAALGVPPRPLYVYLPPGYDTDPARRYPVVYLLHGYPGSALDWLRGGAVQPTMDTLIADHLVAPMIVVAPNAAAAWASDSECLDAVGGRKLETYLVDAVVAFVDHRYRTIPDRWSRAIGGMSSGGYCALNLGLRHQGEFSVILAHEPYGTPGLTALHRLLGGSQARYRANSPALYLPTLRFRLPMAVFVDAGSSDAEVVRTARRLAELLAGRGQKVAFRIAWGAGHSWREARVELPYSLMFAARHLAGGTTG